MMKSPFSFPSILALIVALSLSAAVTVSADPAADLAKFSVFGRIDPASLANGEIKTAAGPPMSTARYLSVQSVFLIPQPPQHVLTAMRHFNPTAHRELKVYIHSDLPASPSASNFSRLSNPPNNSAVESLKSATQKTSTDLQLNNSEIQKNSPGQSPFSFWIDVLTKRAQAFASGGAAAEPPYNHSGPTIQPAKEFSGLMRQQGAVDREFSDFLSSTGLIGGRGSLRPDLYWELLQVEDQGVVALGASYTRNISGGGFQSADGFYYASGGFYVTLTLYQVWPVNVGGKQSSLVWRGDFVSAASLGELHGVERLASEGAMKKDILRAATIIQQEASR